MHSTEPWQSCTVSDEHDAAWQLDEVIWVPPGPVYGSPQQACPDMQSADALQCRPSTHERSVFSQAPLSKHLNDTNSPKGQTELPGHVHGSPLSGNGQKGGGLERSAAASLSEWNAGSLPLQPPSVSSNGNAERTITEPNLRSIADRLPLRPA